MTEELDKIVLALKKELAILESMSVHVTTSAGLPLKSHLDNLQVSIT